MVLKTNKGLHAQKENYSILLVNIKANKEGPGTCRKTIINKLDPGNPLSGGSQNDTEDGSVI